MSRWLLWALSCAALSLLPTLARAQQRLSVLASGSSLQPTRTSSTTYIEVTRTQNGAPVCTYRCEPNAGCATASCGDAPYDGVASRLVYDVMREKLVSCNGATVTVEGAECSLGTGVLTATTHVRIGSLKIIPKAIDDHRGLLLDTGGAGVRLQFPESADDFWSMGYYSGFGTTPMFTASPAGTFRVVASDLRAHCRPTQADPALEVTIPEGGQVELTVLFRGTDCQLTVQRTLSPGASGGTVQTNPPGLTCGAEPTTPCTGLFPFGTRLTLLPQPVGMGGYSFKVGNGCVPGNEPCAHTLQSDRTFSVNFNLGGSSSQDAGAASADSGTGGADGGAADGGAEAPDSGIPAAMGDAASAPSAPDDGGSSTPDAAAPSGDNPSMDDAADAGDDSGCALQGDSDRSSATGSSVAVLLLGLLLARGRRRR